MKRIRRFIAEAISELRKVTWPTFAQTRNLTVLVFAVSLAVGTFIAVIDAVLIGVRNWVLLTFGVAA